VVNITRHKAAAAAFIVVTCLAVLFGLARHFDRLPEGLHGSYFTTRDWSSAPVHSTLDPQPSTERLIAAWDGNPPSTFSATWTGSFIALDEDTYTFATASDDGSWVYVDDMLVVENGDRHGTQLASGSIHLARGVHAIFIKYFQDGGDFHFDLLWSRSAASLEPVPSWALTVGRPWFPRFAASVFVARSPPLLEWLWFAMWPVCIGAVAWPQIADAGALLARDSWSRALAAVVAGSFVLNLIGIWWGIPSTWAGDEITPKTVLAALEQHFSGGWFERYPPLHFYVLTSVLSPWLLVRSLTSIRPFGPVDLVVELILSRLVSIAAAMGTLIAVYACGARVFGKRAGLFAAGMMALVTPFVFYAKTANVEIPYVFWVALSLVFYVRFLRTPALADGVLFASAATLAICTKDQAYALYLTAPFVIVYHLWEWNGDRRVRHPLLRALLDRRLLFPAVTAATLFVVIYNMPFNWEGFIRHVQFITGPGSRTYRAFEPTLSGRLALLRVTAELERRSWGWPFWIVTLIGTFVAVTERENRRIAICLVLLMVTYYVGFIDVILYNYDRFLLPICVVQALLGGVALDRFLRRVGGHATRGSGVALVSIMFAYTALYVATVDVLMVRDSRYSVERWLRGRVGPEDIVGTMFPIVVLPRPDGLHYADIGTIDQLRKDAPAFYVLNADYARAIPAETPGGQLIAGLQRHTLGYRLVFRDRSPTPWPWLPGGHPDLVGPKLDIQLSFLSDINPTTEVYQRDGPSRQ
jgi:PA14 domain-containing protein/dolichyl-phosphate-mannose-protein mannosyltransferase